MQPPLRWLPDCSKFVRRLIALGVLGWAGWLLFTALQRWRFEQLCAMVCGPFAEPELIDGMRRAMDWQTPLVAALLLLLAGVPLQCLGRARGRRSI
jgi:hypothetical protein